MPDIFGASGQFSIDALGAQNQNALNNAYGSGGFGGTVGQYAPYPMFGEPSGPGTMQAPQQAPQSNYNDLTARYWELMGGGGSRGASSWTPPSYGGGYNPYDPSIYAPAAQPNIGGQQPRAAAPQQENLVDTYYRLMGRANPASMSMNPYLSLGYQGPQTQLSIDPQFDVTPEHALGHPGTRDFNVIDPGSAIWQQQQPQFNPGSRNSITNALLNQPQVAQGVS